MLTIHIDGLCNSFERNYKSNRFDFKIKFMNNDVKTIVEILEKSQRLEKKFFLLWCNRWVYRCDVELCDPLLSV